MRPDETRGAALRRPKIAYVMSRFPKLTETFVLYEMDAVEAQGTRVEVYPLQSQREAKMHAEAARWVERAHYGPLLSWPILQANLAAFARRPVRYTSTLLSVVRRNWGSARYLSGGLAFFPKAVYWADRMANEGVDHVHAHFASHPAAVAWVIHRLSGIPYSFTAHGSDLHRDRHMLRDKVADAEFVVAISSYNRQVILDECGPQADPKVVVIHCGVDLDAFHPERASAKQNGHPPALDVLCIGTLHEVKGQTYLIEACRQLAERGHQVACHLIGDGEDQQQLVRQARQAGIADRVHFLGRLDQREVREALRRADVLAAPSVPTHNGRREGIPVALMEGMASGVPSVGSRISGIPELIEDGESGLLVEPRDAKGLADALERLLRDPQLRRRLGAAGRAKVEREFDLRKSAASLSRRFASRAQP
ncbi:MAG TPA: glycosyltransferase family 4 protein [Candidatus Limnocylindria bacterium]|nr:glycosyltransferase family 4 protein [Candidatus Limnocylindria bacterium]